METHVSFQLEMVMLRLTVCLKSMLFEKAMRRSIQGKNGENVVDISNLFTSDMENILSAGCQLNSVWIMPIQIVVILYMLYQVLDLAAFAGVGVIVLTTVLNTVVANRLLTAFGTIMERKDARMKAIKEAFGAIQIVKLNAWEGKFFQRIQQLRQTEMEAIAKYMYTIALTVLLYWGAPVMVSTTSFVTYAIVLGKKLTAAKVFTAMALFNALRDPISFFPDALQSVLQASISLSRINQYLATEEVKHETISRDATKYAEGVMIAVENASFSWKSCVESDPAVTSFAICDVNFQIYRGDFAVVHGPVGAGKSSLLAAILGELPRVSGEVFVRTDKVAYYSQQPWVQNLSIRDNILFGLPFDAKKYQRVIDACGLVKDLKQFPAGDMTEIGQKGVNLSGGQKARVSLARACYSDADIYILDSPLAAVDAVVQSEIFNKCLCGLLGKKTVVLVTQLKDIINSEAANVKVSISSQGVVSATRHDHKPRCPQQVPHTDGVGLPSGVVNQETLQNEPAIGTLVDEEVRVDGRVSYEIFKTYYDALGGFKVAVLFSAVLILWRSCQVGGDIWLSHWTGGKPDAVNDYRSVEYNLTVYGLLSLGGCVFLYTRSLVLTFTGLRAARKLFDGMTRSLLHAPLRFYDSNPIGRVLNRYSEDVSNVDFRLPFSFFGIFGAAATNISQLLAAVYVIKYVGLLILPLVYIYVRVGAFYLSSSRGISRLLKVSTSPILSHIAQSEEGIVVLRAFGPSYVSYAVAENSRRIDANNRVWYAQTVVNQWFALRVNMIGFAVVVLVVSTLVVLREFLTPGLVGLAFMYSVNVEWGLSMLVRSWSSLELTMVSPERIAQYVAIAPEGQLTKEGAISTIWHQAGSISFEKVVFAYKPGGESVLKGLSFDIKPNENIGIVGRTGAGKSSLAMALFRINELESGRILIDGQDISTINLQTLRLRMSIIPQVPVLFKGPLRAYMDPFGEYDDADIWQAFDKIGLKDMISAHDGKLDHELSENGENFSVGERQMLCLARALLRQSRMVVMDEATASIDLATEQKLQATIRREFVDATVLTIAHRLATVLDSDRIMVLSDGRVVEFDTPKRLVQHEDGAFRELAKEAGCLGELMK